LYFWGDDWDFLKDGVKTHFMASMSPLYRHFFCIHLNSLWINVGWAILGWYSKDGSSSGEEFFVTIGNIKAWCVCPFVSTGNYQGRPRDDGTGTGVSELHLFLTRGDLGTKLECQAENDAIDHPLAAWVELDVLGKVFNLSASFFLPSFAQTRALAGPPPGHPTFFLCFSRQ
jgi:hypothetical protein